MLSKVSQFRKEIYIYAYMSHRKDVSILGNKGFYTVSDSASRS